MSPDKHLLQSLLEALYDDKSGNQNAATAPGLEGGAVSASDLVLRTIHDISRLRQARSVLILVAQGPGGGASMGTWERTSKRKSFVASPCILLLSFCRYPGTIVLLTKPARLRRGYNRR